MKLYKILDLFGDLGVSVFPAEDEVVDPGVDLALPPWNNFAIELMKKGYTGHESSNIVMALAAYALNTLKLRGLDVYAYCGQVVHELEGRPPPAQPIDWLLVIMVAVAVAVALGLYLWVHLDKETGVSFGTHPQAYFMTYNERVWQCEILNVGYEQEGMYEQGFELMETIDWHNKGIAGEWQHDEFGFSGNGILIEGRHPIFWHEYRIRGARLWFCGLLTQIGAGLYKLRSGGNDPYRPWGPWFRSGGRFGTPEYDGCWVEWWWL